MGLLAVRWVPGESKAVSPALKVFDEVLKGLTSISRTTETLRIPDVLKVF